MSKISAMFCLQAAVIFRKLLVTAILIEIFFRRANNKSLFEYFLIRFYSFPKLNGNSFKNEFSSRSARVSRTVF